MSLARPARLVAASALALVALALDAFAGDQSKRLPNDVEVRVWSRWPSQLHKGWAPVFVDVRNEGAEPQEVKLRAENQDWRAKRTVLSEFTVEAGAAHSIELLVPVDVLHSSDYFFSFEVGDERLWLNGIVGSTGVDGSMSAALLFTEREFEAGELERWNAETSRPDTGAATAVTPSGLFVSVPAVTRRKPAAGATPLNVDFALVRGGDLARQPAAYSSLDLVVLDSQTQWPAESDLAGLTTWLRSGGEVAVLGPNAERAARALPAFEEWLEPRFELADAPAGGVCFRCGLGRLWIESDGDEATLEARRFAWLGEILGANRGVAPSLSGWRGRSVPADLDLATLPHRTFAVLLIAFAVLIGPLNFWLVARRKRPVLLLVTIPAISAVVTILLLVYGVLFQGLDVKTASWSTTVLDQRAHRSSTLELRHLFAGLAPASGLRPGAGTVVYEAGHAKGFSGRDRGHSFETRHGSSLLLSGQYLPTRREVVQQISCDRAERARLDIEFGAGRVEVQNNLGADVLALLVVDDAGESYASEERLAVGGRATLERITPEQALAHREKYLTNAMPPTAIERDFSLPAGCYLAHVDRGAFLDDCGVECNELEGYHVVLGVLSDAAKERR
jgi:hypothetical protein